jgi:hypothetical protein
MSNLGDFGSGLGAIVALGAAAFAAFQARIQHRREDFEVARTLHADLTTGPVAEARDLLGAVVFTQATPAGKSVDDVLRAHFTLLWSFERIEGGRRSMAARRPKKIRERTGDNPVVFLDEVIGWHVRFWRKGFDTVREWLEQQAGAPVDDEDSRAAFERLALDFAQTPAQPGPVATV